jgi:hypothetical protein
MMDIGYTIFRIGDKVNYKGGKSFKPVRGTYIWAVNHHLMLTYYIQHPDGNITKETLQHNNGMPDGFESPHSSMFKEGLKYICIHPDEIEKA